MKGSMSLRGWESTQGEKHRNAKLNEDAVREIRKSTRPIEKLAKKFGISPAYVKQIKNRYRWKHVTDEVES